MEIEKTETRELTFEEEITARLEFYVKLARKLKISVSEVMLLVAVNELVWVNKNLDVIHEHLNMIETRAQDAAQQKKEKRSR